MPKKREAESTNTWSNAYDDKTAGYGYLRGMSVKVRGVCAAEVNGGQRSCVDPTHDAVIVVTADSNGGGDVFGPAINLVIPASH